MATSNAEEKALELCWLIKDEIERRGYTQAEFAKRMRVSLPTLKRWLAGQGVDLTTWYRLLDELGLSMADTMARLSERHVGQVEYSLRQEDALAKTPGLLAYFNEMLIGKDPTEIMKEHHLSLERTVHYLRKLADVELVEWHGMNVAFVERKFRNSEPKWRKGGPLSKLFRQKLVDSLVFEAKQSPKLRLGLYSLLAEDIEKIEAKISEAYEQARQAENRARLSRRKRENMALMTFFEKHEPEFLTKISNRKTGAT
ncbi:MAG TPA: helix-turn-helix transcriptional regulator [Bdellovibrionales bacterium]|nr:helix-turn-helix transcriptional regulator [Bdellovibrionales bacterium]